MTTNHFTKKVFKLMDDHADDGGRRKPDEAFSDLAQERQALRTAERHRDAILRSTSWRVTAPLRWLQRLRHSQGRGLLTQGADSAPASVTERHDLMRVRHQRLQVERAVDALLASRSWALSALLRWRPQRLVQLEHALTVLRREQQRMETELIALRRQAGARPPTPAQWAVLLEVDAGVSDAVWALWQRAEQAAANADMPECIRCWQDIVALLGESTPAFIYEQLSDAYARKKGSFGGSREENRCWGDQHKHELLAVLHAELEPPLYLEIGVDEGLGLVNAHGEAIGVDPRPGLDLKVTLGARQRIISQSSDAFFREQAPTLLTSPPALVFIDGMHLFEFALRDFMHAERYSSPHTLIVIDDISPCHPTQAWRRRRSTAWTGDVWKLHQVLTKLRPELTLVALNVRTTGLLLVAGVDRTSTLLSEHYQALVAEHAVEQPPPNPVLEREGAVVSEHPVVKRLLGTLKQARLEQWDLASVRHALAALQPALQQAQTQSREAVRATRLQG